MSISSTTKLGGLVCGLLVTLTACEPSTPPVTSNELDIPAADTVLRNGRIYTMNPARPWAEAVAISDGRFSFVGSSAEVGRYVGDQTHTIDLAGGMALPGLNDIHVHPVYGFTVQLFECTFPGTSTPQDIQQRVAECVAEQPGAEWIIGGNWETNFFVKHDIPSPRAWLDAVSGDKAVVLRDTSFHNRWVNSKALELAGLDKDSPEIPGGEMVRDPVSGEPNGLLYESASGPVMAIVPEWTAEQNIEAARAGMQAANRFGITGIKEAWARIPGLEAYKAIDEAGEVTVHLAVSMSALPMLDAERNIDLDILQRMRSQYRGRHVSTDFVKLSMDGVPSASRTAAMLNDYLPETEGAKTTRGLTHYTPEALARIMAQLDAQGITVKVHAAGDRSVRITLDAIEHARQVNGDSGLRHEVSHAGFIDPPDIPRFAALNAVAEVSPYIWFPSVKIDSIISVVGERGEHYWPMRSLLESGAEVVAGSDWPAGALDSMNPWVGMEAMVSRRNPWGQHPGELWPEQAVTLEQALETYTRNGARALKLEDSTGTIETGKFADLIVLNHNLFEIPVEQISETEVALTLFEGDIVYRR